jgi:DNA-binding SARP family transcriptional activator
VKLGLLRGFRLTRDGETLDVPPAAQRVIAYLALERRSVQRMVIAGTLWIDSNDEQASASLRTALWRLGQVTGEVIDACGTTLELAADIVVDLAQATARANMLVSCPEEHCERDLELLGVAGDLLPDWYEDWVLIERERFRQLRLHALENLCRTLSAVGAHAQAVVAGLTAIEVEPLRESSNRALINAYAAEGNIAEALRHYTIFKRRLARELGMSPTTKMEMLVTRLRTA